MRYLHKTPESRIVREQWRYHIQSQRLQIRSELLLEQRGFCAYTERYVTPLDACDIEHFDNRMKGQPEDDYWNWYAVHHLANMQKRSIESYLPILLPHDPSVQERIAYKNGQFQPIHEPDLEATNLINFLRWNDPTIAAYRNKLIRRMQDLRALLNDEALFINHLKSDPENLSFITVLEAELGINLST